MSELSMNDIIDLTMTICIDIFDFLVQFSYLIFRMTATLRMLHLIPECIHKFSIFYIILPDNLILKLAQNGSVYIVFVISFYCLVDVLLTLAYGGLVYVDT